jgi:hypothetical protein
LNVPLANRALLKADAAATVATRRFSTRSFSAHYTRSPPKNKARRRKSFEKIAKKRSAPLQN